VQTVIFIKKLIKNTLKLNKSACIYLNNLFNHQFHPLKSYIPKQTYGNMKEQKYRGVCISQNAQIE
jgi:hypothetical protein